MKIKMKQLYILLVMLSIATFVQKGYSQSTPPPDGVIFQAVATDAEGNPASNRVIDVKSSIIQSSATGTVVYSESFQVTASSNGVFTIVIGKGTRISGPNTISSLDWTAGPYFLNLKAAVEPSVPVAGWSAANEYVDMGTSQFWSVPFALYAANVTGLNLKVNYTDTASMLANYKSSIAALNSSTAALVSDSIYQANQINGRLRYTDTSSMLNNYARSSNLATVATSGSYNDLLNKPTIPAAYNLNAASASTLGGIKVGTNLSIDQNGVLSAASTPQVQTDWNATSGLGQVLNKPTLSSVATSGSYNDLLNTPTIPAAYNLTAASASTLGGIKVGNNLTIDGNGVLSASSSGVPYSGATGPVNLGAYDLTVNSLTFGKGAGSNNGVNTAVGYAALAANTTGAYNSAFGFQALFSNTTGNYNHALGFQVLAANTTGNSNHAFGQATLMNNVTGSDNIAMGTSALYRNTSGGSNIALGTQALGNSLTGSNNVAMGTQTLFSNSTGYNNTGIGYQSLYINTTGSNNSAIGNNSLSTNTTGSNNTAIGNSADVATNNLSNATAIGNGAIVAASNSIQLGNTSVTNVKTSGTLTAGAVTYPNVQGTSGQVLSTTGSGTLIWSNPITLTTNGTSGAATLSGNTLNIPTPSTGGSTHAVGDHYGDGIVFYTWDNGAHGLIAKSPELITDATGAAWGGNFTTVANCDGLLAGKANTIILASTLGATSAAYQCLNYKSANFGDWYLPSSAELHKLIEYNMTLTSKIIGDGNYISSTDPGGSFFTTIYTDDGAYNSVANNKNLTSRGAVVPIRSF